MTDGAEEVAASSSDAAMFSFPQFRSVTNEITERLKVCSSASCFMEDLADIENSLGKSLAKVSSRLILYLFNCPIHLNICSLNHLRQILAPFSSRLETGQLNSQNLNSCLVYLTRGKQLSKLSQSSLESIIQTSHM